MVRGSGTANRSAYVRRCGVTPFACSGYSKFQKILRSSTFPFGFFFKRRRRRNVLRFAGDIHCSIPGFRYLWDVLRGGFTSDQRVTFPDRLHIHLLFRFITAYELPSREAFPHRPSPSDLQVPARYAIGCPIGSLPQVSRPFQFLHHTGNGSERHSRRVRECRGTSRCAVSPRTESRRSPSLPPIRTGRRGRLVHLRSSVSSSLE